MSRTRRASLLLAVLVALGATATGAETLRTDLTKALVPLDEIISGGPPPDGIPAIDRPVFVAPAQATQWIKPKEPVLALEVNGDARAYPLQILMWHEIVNDTVGGRPVVATGYDAPDLRPFLFNGRPDPRRPPKERVVGLKIGDAPRAYPWPVLAAKRVVHDTLGGQRIVVFYQPSALSVLDDERIERSRAIGAAAVFSPAAGGRALTFEAVADGFSDRETGTIWNLLGRAVRGPLAGQRLRPVPHVDAFWFAWAAFHSSTTVHDHR